MGDDSAAAEDLDLLRVRLGSLRRDRNADVAVSYSALNLNVRAVAQRIFPLTDAFASKPQTRLTWRVLVTTTGTAPAMKVFLFGFERKRTFVKVPSGFMSLSPVRCSLLAAVTSCA